MMLGCIGLKPRWILSQGQNSQVNTSDLLKIPDGKSTLSLTGVTRLISPYRIKTYFHSVYVKGDKGTF